MNTQHNDHALRARIVRGMGIKFLIVAIFCVLTSRHPYLKPQVSNPGATTTELTGPHARSIQSAVGSDNGEAIAREEPLISRMQLCQSQQGAPGWAVPYRHEFWRSGGSVGRSASPANMLALKNAPSVDLNDVIERVSHAFSGAASDSLPTTRSATYTAAFDGEGLRFSPLAPVSAVDPDSEAGISVQARFLTTSIELGGQMIYQSGQSLPISMVLGNTAQVLLDPETGLVEHFEAGSEGAAVSWIIKQPLVGSAAAQSSVQSSVDLVVEAGLSGLEYTAQTASGHHFADASGVARLVVGNARVVDAAGRTWDIPTSQVQNGLAFTVPGMLLAQAQYPIAIDPMIGPEFGIDNPVATPSPAAQTRPTIASNGRTYLVVWENPISAGTSAGSGVRACRISQSGLVLDAYGIIISPHFAQGFDQSSARVASDGSDYLVVWQDLGNMIAAARVSSDGVLLDTNSLVLRQQISSLSHPSVAGQTNGYLVAWQDARNGTFDIYGARVSSAGVVLDTNNLAISRDPTTQTLPAVAAAEGNFLVVWQDNRNASPTNGLASAIFGARVTGGGQVLDNGFIISTSTVAVAPAIAATALNYLVTWQESVPNGRIGGARITHDGVLIDITNLVLSTTGYPQTPVVAGADNEYLVVWQESATFPGPTKILGNLVPAFGPGVSFTNGFPISQAPTNKILPAVAGNGTLFFVVWQDNGLRNQGNVFGTAVDPNGSVYTDGIPIAPRIANAEVAPAVAFDGTNYLAVWSDGRNWTSRVAVANYDIYGARIAPDGSVLDPNGIAICTTSNSQFSAAVAGKAGMFLAVWVDYRNGNSGTPGDIFGARITDAGTVLDTNSIAICTLPTIQAFPAIAAGTSDFLVVWANQSPSLSLYDLFGTRVSGDGIVAITNGISLTTNAVDVGHLALTFNGSEYLVVWSDGIDIGFNGFNIAGLRIGPSGAAIDPVPIAICSRPGDQVNPAVASNGTDFLATWADDFGVNPFGIYAARISASGSVLDPDGFLLSGAGYADYPAVASDGADYLVIWQDSLDILGARVSASGSILDSPPLVIDTNPSKPQLPSLATGGGGQFLALNDSGMFGTVRAVGEFVTLPINHPPVAVAQVSPLFSILSGDTNLYIVSPDGVSTAVTLDASQSYDVDGQPLQFTWYIDGQINAAAAGVLVTTVLPVGVHNVQLMVSDGMTTSETIISFEILSPAAATEQLFLLVSETDTLVARQPLLGSIAQAVASFERGQTKAALNQLGAFQNKVAAQLAGPDPALASQYATAASLLVRIVSAN